MRITNVPGKQLATLIVCAVIFLLIGTVYGRLSYAQNEELTSAQLLNTINTSRSKVSVIGLREATALEGVAILRASQIQQNGANYQSDGNSIYQRVADAVPGTTNAYELSQSFCAGETRTPIFENMMQNGGIAQALMDPRYTVAGVSVQASAPDKCNGYVVVELADTSK